MNEAERSDIVMLERSVSYLEANEVTDDELDFDQETTEYVLAQVEDDYDEVVVTDQVALDDGVDADDDVIPLEEIRLDERDLEVA